MFSAARKKQAGENGSQDPIAKRYWASVKVITSSTTQPPSARTSFAVGPRPSSSIDLHPNKLGAGSGINPAPTCCTLNPTLQLGFESRCPPVGGLNNHQQPPPSVFKKVWPCCRIRTDYGPSVVRDRSTFRTTPYSSEMFLVWGMATPRTNTLPFS